MRRFPRYKRYYIFIFIFIILCYFYFQKKIKIGLMVSTVVNEIAFNFQNEDIKQFGQSFFIAPINSLVIPNYEFLDLDIRGKLIFHFFFLFFSFLSFSFLFFPFIPFLSPFLSFLILIYLVDRDNRNVCQDFKMTHEIPCSIISNL